MKIKLDALGKSDKFFCSKRLRTAFSNEFFGGCKLDRHFSLQGKKGDKEEKISGGDDMNRWETKK